ncbi:MAG TPA: hypothetical protein VMU02_05240 [bacterium]|nr:hypothetical protein [bacterium]
MKIMAILGVLLMASAAYVYAQPGTNCDLPANYYEVDTWTLINGVAYPNLDPACALARLFASGHFAGSCNKGAWEIPVTIHASIAQWLWFDLSGTRWDWRVLKPGTYAGDCITFQFCSNGDIGVTYSGFADLYSPTTPTGCKNTIDTWYGYGTPFDPANPANWVRAADLNGVETTIHQICPGHCMTTKLWTKIQVDTCNSACEYNNDAQITLTLLNQKCWVDADGSWWDLPPCVVVPRAE